MLYTRTAMQYGTFTTSSGCPARLMVSVICTDSSGGSPCKNIAALLMFTPYTP